MRTLIAGQARTGTSALYFALQRASTTDLACHFEPGDLDPWTLPAHALVKTLVASLPGDELRPPLDPLAFDRRLVLVRDPRDRLISLLLFLPHWHTPDYPPLTVRAPAQLQRYVRLLEAKVADPTAVTVRTLFEILMQMRFGFTHGEALPTLRALQQTFVAWHGTVPEAETVRYEELMGEARAPHPQDGLPPRGYAQLRRAGRIGEWRQWFTPEDVRCFLPTFQPYLTWYGYGDEWTLPAQPSIDTATSVDYVRTWLRVQRRQAYVSP